MASTPHQTTGVISNKYIFVQWGASKILDAEEFYRKLEAAMPSGAQIFGCQVPSINDEYRRYLVLVEFPDKIHTRKHWNIADRNIVLARFRLTVGNGEDDTAMIRFTREPDNSPTGRWIEKVQDYCSNAFNTSVMFGNRILFNESRGQNNPLPASPPPAVEFR
jgi:hypothetical protein